MVAGDPSATITDALERLSQVQRVLLQEVSTAQGLSPIQVRILGLVTDAAVRPSELAGRLGVTRATVTDAVRALEGKGLVVVAPDPHDGRGRLLQITADGQSVAGRVASWGMPVTHHLAALPLGDQGSVLAGLQAEAARVPVDDPATHLERGRSAAATASTGRADSPGVARCELLGADLPDTALRLDCPEHQAAD